MQVLLPKKQQIWVELNGERLATAQSLKCTSVKNRKAVYAFGQAEPVAWLERPTVYRVELSRIVGTGKTAQTALHGLSGFHLVTVQDGVPVVYTGCEWEEMEEAQSTAEPIWMERAVLLAAQRRTGEE